jgi:hypothetical protein
MLDHMLEDFQAGIALGCVRPEDVKPSRSLTASDRVSDFRIARTVRIVRRQIDDPAAFSP